jgi:hypothetical protein
LLSHEAGREPVLSARSGSRERGEGRREKGGVAAYWPEPRGEKSAMKEPHPGANDLVSSLHFSSLLFFSFFSSSSLFSSLFFFVLLASFFLEPVSNPYRTPPLTVNRCRLIEF